MPRKTARVHPTVERLLVDLGQNLRLARLRRRLSMARVAERAGMSRTTLRSIESGHAGVSLGAVANVLHALDLHAGLGDLARDDVLGRKLQDLGLPVRQRAPKTPRR